MKLKPEDEEFVKYLLNEVQAKLNKAESIIMGNEGYTPFSEIGISDWDKIDLPKNSIQPVNVIIQNYGLEYLSNEDNRSNIAYLIQYLQFMELLTNRFNIVLTINQVLISNAIVNLYSIYECIMDELVLKIKAIKGVNKKEKRKGLTKMESLYYKYFDDDIMFRLAPYKQAILQIEEERNKIHLSSSKNKLWYNDNLSTFFYKTHRDNLEKFLSHLKKVFAKKEKTND